jgi:HlyD family secretion protein
LQDITIGPPNIRRMWQFKIEYLAKENTLVDEGEVVLRFDGDRLKNDLVGYRADLNSAIKQAEKKQLKDQAKTQDLVLNLAETKKDLEIAQRKVEITDASRSEIERRKQQVEYKIATELYSQAQQQLEQHKQAMVINQQVSSARIEKKASRVNTIEQSIVRLEVKAPKKGMVVYQADGDDNKPAVGETVYMGRTLISLPSIEMLAVKVEFDESHTQKVALGQSVKVVLDTHPEKPFSGKIVSLGQAYRDKSVNNLKVVFDAWVELDELDADIMRPGMKANVELL